MILRFALLKVQEDVMGSEEIRAGDLSQVSQIGIKLAS